MGCINPPVPRAHLWGVQLHDPCRLRGPRSGKETKGGSITHASKWAMQPLPSWGSPKRVRSEEWLQEPYPLWAHRWLHKICLLRDPMVGRNHMLWLHRGPRLASGGMDKWRPSLTKKENSTHS